MEKPRNGKRRSHLIIKSKIVFHKEAKESPSHQTDLESSREYLFLQTQIWVADVGADVRMSENCPTNYLVLEAQKAQNKLLRILSNKKLSDRISTKTLLETQNMLSVNQLSAQIKLTEMWKAKYDEEYPLKFKSQKTAENARETRGNSNGKLMELGRTKKSITSFYGDAPRIWNKAPREITKAKSLAIAKKEIRIFCKTLPI